MQIYTTTLTSGELVLNKADGAMTICIQVNTASSCLLTGGIPFKGETPTPITMDANQVFNFTAASASSPLDGITITWVSGSVDIVIGF